MPADLDPRDLDEVRRRVVGPVIHSLIRPDELEAVAVTTEVRFVPFVGRGEYVDVEVKACGERVTVWSWPLFEDDLWDAHQMADELYDRLRDDLTECRFSWGEVRDGDYVIPGPSQH